jgi:Deoxyhypusine synthase
MTKPYFKEKVRTIEVNRKTISELLEGMKDISFQGRSLGQAFDILCRMLTDEEATIIMGLAGSLSTAGMWK